MTKNMTQIFELWNKLQITIANFKQGKGSTK